MDTESKIHFIVMIEVTESENKELMFRISCTVNQVPKLLRVLKAAVTKVEADYKDQLQ